MVTCGVWKEANCVAEYYRKQYYLLRLDLGLWLYIVIIQKNIGPLGFAVIDV